MGPKVILVYDRDCPNVLAARRVLREALERAGLRGCWEELERSAPGAPRHVRGYGSPTILVDDTDVGGDAGGACATACRVYLDEHGGLGGTPPVEAVVEALQAAHRRRARDPG